MGGMGGMDGGMGGMGTYTPQLNGEGHMASTIPETTRTLSRVI